jgi:hypothetical protein
MNTASDTGTGDFSELPDPILVDAVEQAKQVMRSLGHKLDDLDAETLDLGAWLNGLASVGLAIRELQEPGRVIGEALGASSGKARIRDYFLLHLGEVIQNYELAGVAGTLEWARRVRELALEEGWDITRGPSQSLKPGEYRLDAEEVDPAKAMSWRRRNIIRRRPGSGSARCLAYLQIAYPHAASKEDLAYVSRINEWPRRMRELVEQGWSIVSSQDDPSLPPGSYRLETLTQGPKREREAIKQRQAILERDQWTCTRCGATPGNPASTRLQVHHQVHVQDGGKNDDRNLVTLCVPCHAGEHSLRNEQVEDELLDPAADPFGPHLGGQ